MRKLLPVLMGVMVLFGVQQVKADKPDYSEYEFKGPFEARSLSLIFSLVKEDGTPFENDYRLFGTIKEALEKTWKNRPLKIKIKNGLVFNSRTTTKGEIGRQEFELRILILAKFRVGKLLYTYSVECTQHKYDNQARLHITTVNEVFSDLIRKSKFYTEMKTITNKVAKSCP